MRCGAQLSIASCAIVLLCGLSYSQTPQVGAPGSGARDLEVTVGKSVVVESPVNIQRVSVANGDIAEAVAATPREVVVNGKAPGETSLIVWQANGSRLFFDVIVHPLPDLRLEAAKREIAREIGSDSVTVDVRAGNVFVAGTVPDMIAAERTISIASTLGKPVNLLRVIVPPAETQILLKVRFANVDRAMSRDLGANIFSTGFLNTPGAVTTGTFSPPRIQTGSGTESDSTSRVTVTDVLNVFLLRPDLNLGATIRALQSKRLLEILAEPNVLAINGRPASFLAGGEFPFPTLQGGGAGLGAVTIQFREFGVRINVTPTMTPRGTIRMSVTPEVSSLDFANGLVFQGFNIPALSTRRVQTEIEVEDGQSFAIGGLLDNRVTESLVRIPGLGDIPFFGKLFRSQQLIKNNSELVVIVTPEIVRPIPKGSPLPALKYPLEFLVPNTSGIPPRTPGIESTGAVPLSKTPSPIPVEELDRSKQTATQTFQAQPGHVQFVPVQTLPIPVQPQAAPPVTMPPPAAQPSPARPPQPGSAHFVTPKREARSN